MSLLTPEVNEGTARLLSLSDRLRLVAAPLMYFSCSDLSVCVIEEKNSEIRKFPESQTYSECGVVGIT